MEPMSGGSIRDLFRLIRYSLDGVDDDDGKITEDDVQEAIYSLIRDYDRLVFDEDVIKLKQVARIKRIPNRTGFEMLLQNRLIHEYQNHKNWKDLHPAVKRIIEDRDKSDGQEFTKST